VAAPTTVMVLGYWVEFPTNIKTAVLLERLLIYDSMIWFQTSIVCAK